jgi:hypothetical protein
MLSCYDNHGIKMPSDWLRFDFSSTCSAIGKVNGDKSKKFDMKDYDSSRIEVVYKRLNKVPVRPEIQALYDSGAFYQFTGS